MPIIATVRKQANGEQIMDWENKEEEEEDDEEEEGEGGGGGGGGHNLRNRCRFTTHPLSKLLPEYITEGQ